MLKRYQTALDVVSLLSLAILVGLVSWANFIAPEEPASPTFSAMMIVDGVIGTAAIVWLIARHGDKASKKFPFIDRPWFPAVVLILILLINTIRHIHRGSL